MKKMFIAASLFLSTYSSLAQTQSELNEQAHKKYVKADNELNSIYQKIMKDYKDDTVFIKNLKALKNFGFNFEMQK